MSCLGSKVLYSEKSKCQCLQVIICVANDHKTHGSIILWILGHGSDHFLVQLMEPYHCNILCNMSNLENFIRMKL